MRFPKSSPPRSRQRYECNCSLVFLGRFHQRKIGIVFPHDRTWITKICATSSATLLELSDLFTLCEFVGDSPCDDQRVDAGVVLRGGGFHASYGAREPRNGNQTSIGENHAQIGGWLSDLSPHTCKVPLQVGASGDRNLDYLRKGTK